MTGGDFIVERLSIRCDGYVIHDGGKLVADSFLFGMKPMSFIAIGNCSVGDFSTPLRSARNDRDGMGAMVFHDGRKLFANGFLFGVIAM